MFVEESCRGGGRGRANGHGLRLARRYTSREAAFSWARVAPPAREAMWGFLRPIIISAAFGGVVTAKRARRWRGVPRAVGMSSTASRPPTSRAAVSRAECRRRGDADSRPVRCSQLPHRGRPQQLAGRFGVHAELRRRALLPSVLLIGCAALAAAIIWCAGGEPLVKTVGIDRCFPPPPRRIVTINLGIGTADAAGGPGLMVARCLPRPRSGGHARMSVIGVLVARCCG